MLDIEENNLRQLLLSNIIGKDDFESSVNKVKVYLINFFVVFR